MENLNVEQVKRGLERCANEWHCGLCGFTEKECALIKKRALSIIKSQEQDIKRLEKLCALRDQDNKDTQDLLYKAEAENERLHASCTELEKKYALAVAEREADVKGFSKMLAVIHDYTVQKMQDRFNKFFGGMDATQVLLRRTFDQIAKEMLEGEKT